MPKILTRDDAVANIQSRYAILMPDGDEISLDLNNSEEALKQASVTNDAQLVAFVRSELGLNERKPPPSIGAMRRLELIDYEPASDSGHFRFYPNGSLIMDLLVEWANDIAVNRLKAMKIETPELYDWAVQDIREQGLSFHERHYTVSAPGSNKQWVLRFAGDFGLFRMLKDAHISYRNLPMRIYELSKSYRYEKRGELSGLKRLRYFTMPDIHSFTETVESGFEEYSKLFGHYADLADEAGVDFSIVFRVVSQFYVKHRDRIAEMLRSANRPAFIEILSDMKHYWVLKNEFQAIDSVGGTCQLSTVQLDTVDSERYGIGYTDRNGEHKGCIICHSSIGSIERWIYSSLENALKLQKPVLPLWISPTQIRVIPVSGRHLEYAYRVRELLDAGSIRCDMDDRNEKIGRKIMEAERKWIPYVAVVGDRELEENTVTVNDRYNGTRLVMSPSELKEKVLKELAGKPWLNSRLPPILGKRPSFV